jgi:hypothetical protein
VPVGERSAARPPGRCRLGLDAGQGLDRDDQAVEEVEQALVLALEGVQALLGAHGRLPRASHIFRSDWWKVACCSRAGRASSSNAAHLRQATMPPTIRV